MVRGIWVEQLDAIKRTEILKTELRSHGYKLSATELVNLLKRKVEEKIINKITSRKVCVIGSHQTPTMIAIGMMRLNSEYGFYFSILKMRPGEYPEMRLIIENEQEFESWFECFVKELSHHPFEVHP